MPDRGVEMLQQVPSVGDGVSVFFRFYRAFEIILPVVSAFDEAVHFFWGDVSVGEDGRTL